MKLPFSLLQQAVCNIRIAADAALDDWRADHWHGQRTIVRQMSLTVELNDMHLRPGGRI
ncbi:hypothetical protein [Noviherbaspirillum malthae]|uniref:hypothetical protein n=1 Tax=Noviherbaspirillum malthae TaxID=1260987 RepID=UPI00188EDE0A|nr:hypothetical protein [Noviherbaspirillum malthae]